MKTQLCGGALILAIGILGAILAPVGLSSASAAADRDCSMVPTLGDTWCTVSEHHVDSGVLPAVVQAVSMCHVGGDPSTIDGVVGPKTNELIREVQRELLGARHVDGYAGPQTVRALLADLEFSGRTLDANGKVVEWFRLGDTPCVVEAFGGTGVIVRVLHDDLGRVQGAGVSEDELRRSEIQCGAAVVTWLAAAGGLAVTGFTFGIGAPFAVAFVGATAAGVGTGASCDQYESDLDEYRYQNSTLPKFGSTGEVPSRLCRDSTERLGRVRSSAFGTIEAHQSRASGCGVYLWVNWNGNVKQKTLLLLLHNRSTDLGFDSRIGVIKARADHVGVARSMMAIDDARIKSIEICWAEGTAVPSKASIMDGSNGPLRCYGPYRTVSASA